MNTRFFHDVNGRITGYSMDGNVGASVSTDPGKATEFQDPELDRDNYTEHWVDPADSVRKLRPAMTLQLIRSLILKGEIAEILGLPEDADIFVYIEGINGNDFPRKLVRRIHGYNFLQAGDYLLTVRAFPYKTQRFTLTVEE